MSVVWNTHTKFAKLQVGKHVVSARQQNNSQVQLFPLVIALSGLSPISKVSVDYKPKPNNNFVFRVNDADVYNLVKEEVDFDPTKTEVLKLRYLKVNDIEAISN